MKETKSPNRTQSIGKKKAIALCKSGWWKNKTAREIAEFQLLTDELCVSNFGVFHKALEDALGRPVFTHELALNRDGLINELLDGNPAPTFQEILNLIPEEKRIIIAI